METRLEGEWLIPRLKIVVHALSKLFLDEVRPEVGLVVIKCVGVFTLKLFFVRLAKLRVENDYFPRSVKFWEQMALADAISSCLYGHLRRILFVINLMVLCEFENYGLVYLALFTGIDNVHQIHALIYQSVRSFT